MSVLTNYVERLERSIERNQAILQNDIGEFEDLCNRGVELGDAAVLRQAEKFYKRALARFKEIEQVEQVLRGPKYRGLVSRAPQRETILLTVRGRYHQAFARVERWRNNDPQENEGEAQPRPDRAMPFESPRRVEALHNLVIYSDRNADGVPMAVSFIVIQGDAGTVREIPVDGSGIGERDLIERTTETEVRVALHHPAALSSEVIEKVVLRRFFSSHGHQVRAAVYRLSAPSDLHPPFLSAIRLNLPRVGNREVLTLNPLDVGAGLAGNLA
ncbi:MAG: hypothetical protein PVF51_01500 [Nitrospirota bacterium]|jgi:hypothetical protein